MELEEMFGKSQPVAIDLDGTRGMGFVSALQSGSLDHVCFVPTGNDRNTQCEEPAGMDIDRTCIRALQLRGPGMAHAITHKSGKFGGSKAYAPDFELRPETLATVDQAVASAWRVGWQRCG